MPQYAEPWKHRILNSTLAAIRNYPTFPRARSAWDDRVFHPDAREHATALELWRGGRAPVYLSAGLGSCASWRRRSPAACARLERQNCMRTPLPRARRREHRSTLVWEWDLQARFTVGPVAAARSRQSALVQAQRDGVQPGWGDCGWKLRMYCWEWLRWWPGRVPGLLAAS